MTSTPGQKAIAHAVDLRLEAGDGDERVIKDLLTALAAVISDLPVESDRAHALAMAAALPDVVANQVKKMARAA